MMSFVFQMMKISGPQPRGVQFGARDVYGYSRRLHACAEGGACEPEVSTTQQSSPRLPGPKPEPEPEPVHEPEPELDVSTDVSDVVVLSGRCFGEGKR